MKTFAGLLVAALLVCSWSGTARAEVTLSAEGQAGFLVLLDDEARFVGGGAGRVGYAFDSLYPILVMPELSLEGHVAAVGTPVGIFRGVGGLRFGVLAAVEPSIYVHAGYGGMGQVVDLLIPGESPVVRGWMSAFSLDAGAALDYRIRRWLTLGGALGYVGYFAEGTVHGGTLGFHATFWL